jgi:hypothetical protein|tara:strand:- start:670 stop:897 length:228 start_codon:yes stop_codon:yes gene_type:complete
VKGIIDTSKPVYKYKVLMSELLGYYVDVAASSPEEAQQYANNPNIRKHWNKYGISVVETTPVSAELIEKESSEDE